MKINFLTGSLALRSKRTGVHEVHRSLLRQWATGHPKDWDYTVSCLSGKPDMQDSFPETQFPEFKQAVRYSSSFVRVLAYFLPIELFFGRSDVYVCDGFVPHTIHAAKKVAFIHDMMFKKYPENYSILRSLFLRVYLHSCRRADRIIAVSESTKKDVVEYLDYPADKIDVVYNSFLPSAAAPKIPDDALRNSKYLFYIGDMRRNKNLKNAIEAFRLARKRDNDLVFYIAGSKTGEYEDLVSLVEEYGMTSCVKFLGYVSEEEKAMYYKYAFALLFVSADEGFGLPIIEAAYYGTPVVTSNVSAMDEIGKGKCLTVDPFDCEQIANAILSLEDTDVRSRVVSLQNELVDRFTPDKSYKGFLSSLTRVCGRSK